MLRFILAIMVFLPFPLLGYGPTVVNTSDKVAVRWDLPLKYHRETNLTVNAKDMTTFLDDATAAWVDASDSVMDIETGILRDPDGAAIDDVTGDNVCDFLFDPSACPNGPGTDGQHPIVFDADGSIVAKFFGPSNQYSTLGFAGIVKFSEGTNAVVKGEGVFNAACLSGAKTATCPSSITLYEDDMEAIIVHELGHFLGCNHTQVNLTASTDGDSSNNNLITTMYPFFIPGSGEHIKTLERDDEICLADLYPASDFAATTCTISGTIFDQDLQQMQCANVVARNTDATQSETDAISYVTGQLSAGGTLDGRFVIKGLTPGETYSLEVEQIYEEMTGSSGIKPCHQRPANFPLLDSDGNAIDFPPTFDAVSLVSTYTCTAGDTTSGVVSTLTNVNANPADEDVETTSSSGGCSFIPN